ncbi:MAG: Nif3-like dinuclear metal center hexameric protein [Ruminococcus sp.]|jgi:dinuclear metal center YbgI/SA1388 family protein|nr:Nif3-like dinuclear metal center hexameric protein [Ruminococcus sp.]
MKLDARLGAVAGFVRGKYICDIGTDHGKLPISLLCAGICEKALCTDINKKPLDTAKKNAEKAGARISFCQTDGFDGIDLTEVTDIVIAGMGGELIADILLRGGERLCGKNLILQPMTRREILVNFLLSEGYRITGRKTVFDSGKKYDIINATMVRDMKATVKKIYSALDCIAPFSHAEDWDNSGLLVGELSDAEVDKVLVALDISFDVVEEAMAKNCGIIISHHPVIFHPLTKLLPQTPSVHAMKNGIACICSHTCFDSSETGMNNIFIPEFTRFFAVDHIYNKTPIEPTYDNSGIGIIFELPEAIDTTASDFAGKLKEMFHSAVVRFTDIKGNLNIKKVAFCSGAGGEFLSRIYDENLADVYITADLKHSHFIDAKGRNFPVFDCGHYATEAMMKEYAADLLRKQFPLTEIIISETDIDPVSIV